MSRRILETTRHLLALDLLRKHGAIKFGEAVFD
jgi:hypothetical protein